MILAAALPNYLPYVSFFHKMMQADCFVLADDLFFSQQTSVSRTKVKTSQGAHLLTVPVLGKGKSRQLIRDVKIDNTRDWRRKHWKSLIVNYSYSPYFEFYADFFERLYQKEWRFLLGLNTEIIAFIRKALNLEGPLRFSSEIPSKPDHTKTERIIEIVQSLKCQTYLAGEGDESFLIPGEFANVGVELYFQKFRHPVYPQLFGGFIQNLSVIDLLFNVGPQARNFINK